MTSDNDLSLVGLNDRGPTRNKNIQTPEIRVSLQNHVFRYSNELQKNYYLIRVFNNIKPPVDDT